MKRNSEIMAIKTSHTIRVTNPPVSNKDRVMSENESEV